MIPKLPKAHYRFWQLSASTGNPIAKYSKTSLSAMRCEVIRLLQMELLTSRFSRLVAGLNSVSLFSYEFMYQSSTRAWIALNKLLGVQYCV